MKKITFFQAYKASQTQHWQKKKEKVIVRHVPDALAAELFQILKDKTLVTNRSITGESRPAREGTWNQGGGIEIPCRYELSKKTF